MLPQAATPPKPQSSKSATNDPPASLPGKLASAVNADIDDHSDYVSCFFSRHQLLALRPAPESATLSSAEAEDLRARLISEGLDPANASAFSDKTQAQGFASEIGHTVFEGLTKSQATSTALSILGKYTASELAKLPQGTDMSQYILNKYATTKTRSNSSELTSAIAKGAQAAQHASDQSPVGQAEAVKSAVDGSIDIPALQNDLDKATCSGTACASKNNIAQATIAAVSLTTRPPDIGCSMSILSYETTRKAFGETMADEYIGVQIVVRNVNPEQEFLVQSAEFKVDDDINGRIGRYYSGVDKMTAREYMLASRDLGKRNLMVHVVQGTGAIVSAMVPFTGPFVKQFSGVYSGAFAGALTTVFPDHNTDQLKLIDDEGFSNSRTDRTVVPKSGTAEFVIFISSKEFEEGWWAQDCAERIAIQSSAKPSTKDQVSCIGTFNQALPDPKCVDAEIGIDINVARRVCLAEHKGDPTLPSDISNPGLTFFKPKNVGYRHWSQQALALFRELSFAVVAGTHVLEESDTAPTLTKIACPVDTQGNVNLGGQKDGPIGCTMTGTNLVKVTQLKLRNYQDATDTKTADGIVTTSGDSKSATASFPVDKLCGLTASAYKVYTVTKDGVEGGGDQLLHFDTATPLLFAGPDPATVDLAKLQISTTPIPIALKGCHLEKVSGVELTGNNQTIDLKITGTSTTTAANVSVGLDDIKSRLTPNHEYAADSPAFSISLQTSAAPKPIPTEQKLSFTGELKGTAPTKTNKQPSGGAKNTKQPAKRTPEGPINNR
jgi:hypothetical protein